MYILREFVIRQQNNHIQSAFFSRSQCCVLFAELFGQCRRKIRPLRKKIPPSNCHFLKEFRLEKNTIFVCVSRKIITFRGDKRRETSSASFQPLLFKIGRRFVRLFHFLFCPFLTMRPSNRPVGSTDCSAAFTTSFFGLVWKFAENRFKQ